MEKTLEALVKQTHKGFKVYIGDDHSPDDIRSIFEKFKNDIEIEYQRFSENIGQRSLVEHWNRCLDMVAEEEWYWLLPDDDVPSVNAVERFFYALKEGEVFSLFRFRTVLINQYDEVTEVPQNDYIPVGSHDMILRKLKYEFNSSVAEYIFSAASYSAVRGFTEYPLAWHSDDMLWYQILEEGKLKYDDKAVVHLRQSTLNISSNTSEEIKWKKLDAHYLFFDDLILGDRLRQRDSFWCKDEARAVFTNYLFYEYKGHNLRFTGKKLRHYARKNNQLLGGGLLRNCYRLLRHNKRLA